MNQSSLNDKIHLEPRARTGAETQLICESNVILNCWKDVTVEICNIVLV